MTFTMHEAGLPRTPKLADLLQQRLADVDGVTLADMLRQSPRLRSISPALGALLEAWPAVDPEGDAAAWARLLARGMTRYLTSEFQYLDIEGASESLVHLYRQFMVEFLATDGAIPAVERTLCAHHDRLLAWIEDRLAEASALGRVRHGFRPVCAEYTPSMQLQFLNLEPAVLMGPVLDLGCGDGRLVRHLRDMGIEATGIDRNAPEDLITGDWFDAPLAPGRWGTILAHQSVSLHFIYAHLHSDARAGRYAALYMRILKSLRPGGSFVYAPSLPFFEPVVARFCTIETSRLPHGFSATRLSI